MEVRIKPPVCDMVVTFTVVALGPAGPGKPSNEAHNFVLCIQPTTNTLTAGAIAGITIVCILFVILLLMLVYLWCNWDIRDELCIWHTLTCRCCTCIGKKEDDNVYNSPPTSSRRNDIIRSNSRPVEPIRNISDLYTKPDLQAKKKETHQGRADEDDGGFREYSRRNENLKINTIENASQASSTNTYNNHAKMPINKVGVPQTMGQQDYSRPAQLQSEHINTRSHNAYGGSRDNLGFDGTSDTDSYNSKWQPPRPAPRNNTKV